MTICNGKGLEQLHQRVVKTLGYQRLEDSETSPTGVGGLTYKESVLAGERTNSEWDSKEKEQTTKSPQKLKDSVSNAIRTSFQKRQDAPTDAIQDCKGRNGRGDVG